jgi:hypothetical protein
MQATVQTLVGQGGVVQHQDEQQTIVYLKKKMNIAVLVIGLILCLVPGLVYLIWYTTADQNQQITVQVGQPPQIRTEAAGQHTHWYDQDAVDGAVPGSVRPQPTTPPARPGATAPPAGATPPAAPGAGGYSPTVDPPPGTTSYPPVSDPPTPPPPPGS